MSASLKKEDAIRSVLTELGKSLPVFVEKAMYNILLTKQDAKVILNGAVAVF